MDTVIGVEDVTAVIVTRGDVDLDPVLEPLIWPTVTVWDNSARPDDLGAYGRYAATARVWTPVVYVQDDDCVVSAEDQLRLLEAYEPGVLTALMPSSRTDYRDTVLVGWGALFDRDLPFKAFARWQLAGHPIDTEDFLIVGADFVFPLLTPCRRLDAEHEDLPWAHARNRTWSRPGYAALKAEFMEKARRIRDGG